MQKAYLLKLFLLVFTVSISWGQSPQKPTASEIYHNLQKLNFLGSVLYIAAHPDDENTRLISYFSNDVNARTAYLSLTRGDGGQNLVGPEIRELLGVIRTQELLAARRIDGGQQFFTRANDFGYSKDPEETLSIWNKEAVLGDVVRTIRKFKPDIIINRFDHRSPGTTHGHHTSSALLSVAAFDLVNDATKYPESASSYGIWQPRSLFFNTSWWFYGSRENFEKADKSKMVAVETGNYYPSLGLSNGEIASLSRSMHKSQGFGSTGSRGTETEYLEWLKGTMPPNAKNIFDGIDTSWSRLEGGKAIGDILLPIEAHFNFNDPSAHVPDLVKAYALLKKLPDSHWKGIKMEALKQLIADCAGLFLEAISNEASVAPRGDVTVTVEAINRSNIPMQLNSVLSTVVSFPTTLKPTPLPYNESYSLQSTEYTFNVTQFSTPYWLEQPGSLGMYRVDDVNLIGLPERNQLFPVTFNVSIAGENIDFQRNITYKYNDPVKGEVYQPFDVLPVVTSSIPEKVIIFSNTDSKEIPVVITSGRENITGTVSLQHPKGWVVFPQEQAFSLGPKGATQTITFTVTPPKEQDEGFLKPLLQVGDVFSDKELVKIDYGYIPFQNVLVPSEAKVVRIPIEKKGEQIGYIEGAGDAIPESLKQIGYQVTTIPTAEITPEHLASFDAIVIGIRAYNTVPELQFKQTILNDYVANGGTLILQYNTSRGLVSTDLAPYPLKLSRDRVTDEQAAVSFLAPNHPVLNVPNKITPSDFEGWVQERGLYFPNEWDTAFTPILGMHDKGEPQMNGSLLVASYGKGVYVYTGLSFFRELPAGVSGAYRLFANLLSLGH
ncbi:MAG TPA: PIG-L family deacetylase [Flavobacteriaceae bacterium]|nr:PIG-L family deacetylase [Flavobacteriaceae bacterium]HPF10698.1 PIG-L family deacetylase [Flavobacteriaceae bacterium]HQU21957.1 PIG-L family deacetylase [Flavobacteriaceae bacterium]HQU66485.1 PIG-L family deacetylase [Flavobacteriaceae bacterium]HRW43187.1 PIG-L family deacetylase [Flavobacteriaceae bacterium]